MVAAICTILVAQVIAEYSYFATSIIEHNKTLLMHRL